MRTLFAKFLVWFWLGLAVLLVAEIVLESHSLREGIEVHSMSPNHPLALYADLARATLAERGVVGVDSLIALYEQSRGVEAYRIDAHGRGTGLHRVSEDAANAGIAALRAKRGTLIETRGGVFLGYPIGSVGQREFAIVLHPLPRSADGGPARNGKRGWLAGLPEDLVLRALAMLVLGGIGCYLLVRYVTAPIARLRQATRSIAEGNLGARVGASAGGRRDELVDLGHDFDRMAERLETLLGAQRRLLTDISHELRSPLARMNVAVALLREQRGDDAEGMLKRLEIESERLNHLIGDVLTLSRSESGEPVPESQPVDLVELVRDIADDAQFEAGGRGTDVRMNDTGPVTVLGVPGLLRSAIDNVVRNAVRHTRAGTAIDITVERREDTGAPAAVVIVRDHGPGLPPDQLERIFEPFYRYGGAAAKPGGTGLGLAIAKRILARHGGDIRADAAPGEGLVVTLRLPAA